MIGCNIFAANGVKILDGLSHSHIDGTTVLRLFNPKENLMYLPRLRLFRNGLSLLGFAFTLFSLLLALFGADTEDAFASRHGGQTGPLGYGKREYTPPPRGDFGGYVWGVVLVDGQPVTDATVTMNYQGRSLTVSTMIITDVHPYAIYMFGILPFSELDAKIGATVTMVAQVSGLVSDPRIVTLEPNRDNEVYQEFYFGIKKPTPTPTLPPPPSPPATDTFTTVVPNRLIAVSREHSCVIANNGGLQCWGHNYYGQLGNGTAGNSNVLNRIYDTPVGVLGLGEGVRAVSTGYGHSCAVLQSGSVKCWGYYTYDRQTGNQPPYVTGIPYDKPQITNAIDIATGLFHNCVLLADRTMKCWGANDAGQLGRGYISGSDDITATTEPAHVIVGNGNNTPLNN
ncbi:MAG: hypothetical protein KDE58_37960, partial [Caldilineaceae bacterium]|nr:hypothetical protein [Caldilineaceae bacterium]